MLHDIDKSMDQKVDMKKRWLYPHFLVACDAASLVLCHANAVSLELCHVNEVACCNVISVKNTSSLGT